MNLIFPFLNITINTFWNYFEEEKVKEFSDIKSGKDTWKKEYFDNSIEYWRNTLPNLENEILQIINTTDQKTIDEYFSDLGSRLNELSEYLTKDYFHKNIYAWNNEILKKYNETVERETDEYAQHENRKRKHLEEYEDWQFGSFLFGMGNRDPKKVKKINYNFYCIEKKPDLISNDIVEEYHALIVELFKELIGVVKKYYQPWKDGEIKSKVEERFIPKPILFVEGDHDITFINRAAELLKKSEILEKVEIRQRGGYRNLDKLWTVLNEESWETTPQIKIFLYDCDTNKENEDFGVHHKRIIPTIPDSIIKKGIENLFPNDFIDKAISEKKAFIDMKKTIGCKRGIDFEEEVNEVNKDEKKNFCLWACEHGTKEYFSNFNVIFQIIEEIV